MTKDFKTIEKNFYHKVVKNQHTTAAKFAKAAKVSVSQFYNFYYGKYFPEPKNAHLLADYLNMNMTDFMKKSGVPLSTSPFSRQLKILRYDRNLTIQQAVNKHHVAPGALQTMEASSQDPSMRSILNVSNIYRVNPLYFFDSIYETKHGKKPNHSDTTIIIMGLEFKYLGHILHSHTQRKMYDLIRFSRKNNGKLDPRRACKLHLLIPVSLHKIFVMFGLQPEYLETLGGKIIKLEILHHITINHLAHRMNLTKQMLSLYTLNQNKPSRDRMNFLKKAFKKYDVE